MSLYVPIKIPLAVIVKELQDMIAHGYNPMGYLNRLLISDTGAQVKKDW